MAQQLHRTAENPSERQSAQMEGGRQREQGGREGGSQWAGRSDGGQQHTTASFSVPVIALRGFGQFYDMQLAATRMFMQTQATAARAFGWPDFSGLFQIGDERVKRVFSSGTEQLVHLAEQANETTSEMQRHMGRMLEFHAANAAENWQRGLEELGHQAEEGLEQLKELARQQSEEAMRAAEAISQETRQSIKQGGEEMRQTMAQAGEQGRQAIGRQAEAGREQAGEAREAGERQQAAGEKEAQASQEQERQRRKAA